MTSRHWLVVGGAAFVGSFFCWALALTQAGTGATALLIAACAQCGEHRSARALSVERQPPRRVDADIQGPRGPGAGRVFAWGRGDAPTLRVDGRVVRLGFGGGGPTTLSHVPWPRALVGGKKGAPVYPVEGAPAPSGTAAVVLIEDGALVHQTVAGRPEGAALADGRTLSPAMEGPRVSAPAFWDRQRPLSVEVSGAGPADVHLDVLSERGACLVRDVRDGPVELDVAACADTFVWVHVSKSPYSSGSGHGQLVVVHDGGDDGPARTQRLLAVLPDDAAREDPLAVAIGQGGAVDVRTARALLSRLTPAPKRAPSCSPGFDEQEAGVADLRRAQVAPWRTRFRGLALLSVLLVALSWWRGRTAASADEALLRPTRRARLAGGLLLALVGLVLVVLDWTLTPLFSA